VAVCAGGDKYAREVFPGDLKDLAAIEKFAGGFGGAAGAKRCAGLRDHAGKEKQRRAAQSQSVKTLTEAQLKKKKIAELREMIDDLLGAAAAATIDTPRLRDEAIERLAAACSGELEHGRTVAALAGRIYQQLTAPLSLRSEDQLLLECAARLQDVGYVINYDQHHKHSYHLIRNSRLPGIRGHDLEIIANVARYHRGAYPKRKHENLARLSAEDQQRVHRMAAILRLAGGLDRSRSQMVRDVIATIDDDGLTLDVVADQEPQVDIWGAERRTELFEKVFGMPVQIRWAAAVKK
jgi:exopolyphosphatase/guanosine-5'-triphosphate,3'-diphosphate pyrophosphatase